MYLSVVYVFLSLAFLVQLKLVESRSSRNVITRQGENIEVENLTVKQKDSQRIPDASVKQASHLQEDHSCECSDYCPDPNSTELQVS